MSYDGRGNIVGAIDESMFFNVDAIPEREDGSLRDFMNMWQSSGNIYTDNSSSRTVTSGYMHTEPIVNTTVADTTDTDKLVLIERLIRTKKITLVEGLLLLKEKVIASEAPLLAPVRTPWTDQWFVPENNPFRPYDSYGTTLGGQGASGQAITTTQTASTFDNVIRETRRNRPNGLRASAEAVGEQVLRSED